jgi:hypothetical protein
VSLERRTSVSVHHRSDELPWHRTPDRHCTLCGRLLIRTYIAAGEHVFCDDECEELYRTYWLPRHGSAA